MRRAVRYAVEVISAIRDVVLQRQAAYKIVFNKDSQHVKQVLQDLARFCRAHDSAFHEDARVHAMLEGRREVFLRIIKQINLSPDELWETHTLKEIRDV